VKHPSQEDLLGYVLGALDAQEERDLQQQIDANPEIEDQLLQLRQTMSPLDSLTFGEPGNRPGLARRTCELVASLKHGNQDLLDGGDAIGEMFGTSDSEAIREVFDDSPASSDSDLEPSSFSRFRDRLSHPRSWSRIDMLAGVAIMAIFASILLPAISHSRFHGRINSCKHNLTQVGNAMLVYSDLHSGRFINIPSVGMASASNGLFAPVLKDVGFIENDALFACAGRAESEPPRIPSIQQIRTAKGTQLDALRRRMGGHFGYALGFFDGDKYSAPKNNGSSYSVIIADMPSSHLPGRGSENHGGKGQNCFFADGHVQFATAHSIGDDAIYENDLGIVGPGLGERDNVIAPCHVPIVRWRVETMEVLE
jgi:hypothetical protein